MLFSSLIWFSFKIFRVSASSISLPKYDILSEILTTQPSQVYGEISPGLEIKFKSTFSFLGNNG